MSFGNKDEFDKRDKIDIEMLQEMEAVSAAWLAEVPGLSIQINELLQQMNQTRTSLQAQEKKISSQDKWEYLVSIYDKFEFLKKAVKEIQEQTQEKPGDGAQDIQVAHESPERQSKKRKQV